jgi:broad specificity phosphatase PhoE
LRTLLIRHAETVWNASSRIQGQADPALSDAGREQCDRLRQRMSDAVLTRIYTSDLERARLTAEAAAAGIPGLQPILDSGLREVSLGEWEGATTESLSTGWPEAYKAWLEGPSWDLVPGGEGERAFQGRVMSTMTGILGAADNGDTIAVVTHIGVIRLLLALVTDTPPADMRWRWAIHNTSITSVESRPDFQAWRDGDVDLVAINDNQHLKVAAH